MQIICTSLQTDNHASTSYFFTGQMLFLTLNQQVIKGRIAAAHRRFRHIRQVTPMCAPCSTPQSAPTPHWCCPLLSHLEYIDSPHVRLSCAGALSSLILALHACGSRPASNTWCLEPTSVHIPNGISIGSAAFAGLMIVTDRPTDRQTTLLRLQQ